jgi:hypothetical protein
MPEESHDKGTFVLAGDGGQVKDRVQDSRACWVVRHLKESFDRERLDTGGKELMLACMRQGRIKYYLSTTIWL